MAGWEIWGSERVNVLAPELAGEGLLSGCSSLSTHVIRNTCRMFRTHLHCFGPRHLELTTFVVFCLPAPAVAPRLASKQSTVGAGRASPSPVRPWCGGVVGVGVGEDSQDSVPDSAECV